MKAKILVVNLMLFLMLFSLIGCSKSKIIKSEPISIFKDNIIEKYDKIETFKVTKRSVSLIFTYTLKQDMTEDELINLFRDSADFIFADTELNPMKESDDETQYIYVRVEYKTDIYVFEGKKTTIGSDGSKADGFFHTWNLVKNQKTIKEVSYTNSSIK